METEQVALLKIQSTLKTCIALCAHSCQREALIGLRDQVLKLFNEAIEGHGTGGKQ